MATPVAALIVRVAADVADLKTSVGQVEGSLNNMASVAKTAAGALAAAFSFQDLAAGVARLHDAAGQIADLSAQMGIGTEAVQRLKFAAEQSGSSIDSVAMAIKTMATNLNDPSAGAKDALIALNLNLETLRGMAPDQAFVAIAEAIRLVPDPMTQSALAVDLFGGRSATLLPAIKAGIEDIGAAAPLMRDQTIASLDESGDKWAEVQGKIDALKANALGPLVDVFLSLPETVQVATGGIMSFIPSLESMGLAIMAAGGPTAALASLKGGAVALAGYLSGGFTVMLGAIVTFFTTTLPAAFGAAIAFLGPQGLIALALLALAAIWYKWGDDISAVVSKVYTAVKEWLLDKLNAIWNGLKQKIEDVKQWFSDMYQAVVGGSFVPDMVNGIAEHFGRLDSVMVSPTQLATQAIQGLFSELSKKVEGIIGNMLDGVGGQFGNFLKNIVPSFLGPLGSLVTSGVGAIVGGIKDKLAGGEEGKLVNPARDAFLLQYGPPGLGEDSGFHNLARRLAEAGRSDLFDLLAQAETMQQFNAAKDAIKSLPGFIFGSGGIRDFGAGTLAMLHGRERVQTEGQMQAENASMAGAIDRLSGRMDRLLDEMPRQIAAQMAIARGRGASFAT